MHRVMPHSQNTMQLLTALTNAGKDADLRIYPPGHHGAAYNQQSSFLIHSDGGGPVPGAVSEVGKKSSPGAP